MFEASKTRRIRGQVFYDHFLSGSVLDIGCGEDPVVPHAYAFDLAQGNAERILEFFPTGTAFDCVHSSHCLEHMRNVPETLAGWWALVKPGGYMIIVVPDEDLYEQGIWPSIFNCDHKATFRIGSEHGSWSPVSYDLERSVQTLPGAELISIEVQDARYDYSKRKRGWSRFGRAAWLFRRRKVVRKIASRFSYVDRCFGVWEHSLGVPIDQTRGDALAQIQAVVRKKTIDVSKRKSHECDS
jgi:SAM-dependent methyltransferase